MSWRNELRTPSFRGVAFNAVELGSESGRRVVADDTPETEELSPTADLGPVRPSFRMRAFVNGDDYLDQRERLLAALNLGEPGELVLPWRGNLFVRIGKVSDTLDMEHGKCVIEFECVLHEGRARPFVEVLPATSAEGQVALASAATTAAYGEAGAPTVKAWLGEWAHLAEVVRMPELEDYDFNDDEWSEAMMGEIATALELVTDARRLLAYLRSAYIWVVHSLGTPGDEANAAAFTAMNNGMRTLALIRMAAIATSATYATADQAEQAMGDYTAEMASWMEDVTDTDLYTALLDLRTTLADVLTAAIDRLPRERIINIPIPTPAIVIAFDTYGAKRLEAREAELIELNGIGHPGFVHGNLKVLSK